MPTSRHWPVRPAPSTVWAMTRPAFLTISLLACAIGIAVVGARGVRLDLPAAAITVLLACLAHASANAWNDWADAQQGSDACNYAALRPLTGGSGLIQAGRVSAGSTRSLALVLAAATVLGGIVLALRANPALLATGVVGVALGWAYSAPRASLVSRGWGEVAVALAWALMVVGAGQVQSRDPAALGPLLLAGLAWAPLVAAILLANGIPDAVADASVGKRTWAVRLGGERVAVALTALACVAYGAALALEMTQALPAVGLLAGAPVSAWAIAQLRLHLRAPQADADRAHLRRALVATIVAAHVAGIGLVAGLMQFRTL